MDYIKCGRLSHVTFICSIREVSFPQVIVFRESNSVGILDVQDTRPYFVLHLAVIVICWKSKTKERRETMIVLLLGDIVVIVSFSETVTFERKFESDI